MRARKSIAYRNFLEQNTLIPFSKNWTEENGTHSGGVSTGFGFTIAWQRGALNIEGRNGAFLIEVLESCYDQLDYLQTSAFPSNENIIALEYLKQSIDALKSRKSRRESEGTFGKHIPDQI